MPLIQANESFPERPVLIIIAGTPFSYKTSLAITAEKPILIDGELGAERAHGRVPTFRINGWGEVETEIQNGMLDNFRTAIVDTGKSVIDDHMWEYALSINYTKNKQKTFGDVADIFKKFVGKLRNNKMDIIVVSHEKSKDEDDARIYDLDITGSSKQMLLRMADQVGFAYKQQLKTATGIITQTVITFNPKKEWPFCKNVAGLADIILPDCNLPIWNGFMDREIIQPTKNAIASMSEEQVQALSFIADWHNKIDAVKADAKELGDTMNEIIAIEAEHLKKQVRAYFQAHLKKINWKYNGTSKSFEPVEPAELTPPAEPEPESNPAALVEKEDPFAPTV